MIEWIHPYVLRKLIIVCVTWIKFGRVLVVNICIGGISTKTDVLNFGDGRISRQRSCFPLVVCPPNGPRIDDSPLLPIEHVEDIRPSLIKIAHSFTIFFEFCKILYLPVDGGPSVFPCAPSGRAGAWEKIGIIRLVIFYAKGIIVSCYRKYLFICLIDSQSLVHELKEISRGDQVIF